MTRLVGYRNFISKKNGREYCLAYLTVDVTERERNIGMVGQKVQEVFLPDDLVGTLRPEHIGREVWLSYEAAGGRAYLTGFAVSKE